MASETSSAPDPASKDSPRPRAGIRHLLASAARLFDLQYKIWLTQAKIAALRIAVFTSLFIGGALLAILAVIFLCIGLFRVLTDVLGLPVWAAFLIFGGLLALVAIILISYGTHMLTGADSKDDKEAKP